MCHNFRMKGHMNFKLGRNMARLNAISDNILQQNSKVKVTMDGTLSLYVFVSYACM